MLVPRYVRGVILLASPVLSGTGDKKSLNTKCPGHFQCHSMNHAMSTHSLVETVLFLPITDQDQDGPSTKADYSNIIIIRNITINLT